MTINAGDLTLKQKLAAEGKLLPDCIEVQRLPYIEPEKRELTANPGSVEPVYTYGILSGTKKPSLFGTTTFKMLPKY